MKHGLYGESVLPLLAIGWGPRTRTGTIGAGGSRCVKRAPAVIDSAHCCHIWIKVRPVRCGGAGAPRDC